MKAIIINDFGEVNRLQLVEIEKPTISADQVLIHIKAAGINPVDAKIRAGIHSSVKTLTLPTILGRDLSGIVSQVGEHVKNFKPGDSVFGMENHAYAQCAAINPDSIALKPENISFEQAAAVPLAGLTAYQAINVHLKIQSGERILIQSAAGGVGHLAVQLAKIAGAWVSGTASGKNIDFIKSLGVHGLPFSIFQDSSR